MPHNVALHEGAPHKEVAPELSVRQVCDLYIGTQHRMRRVVDDAMADCGMSVTQAKALDHLRIHGPVNQRELAALFGFAPRSVTDLIDGLERDGLAKRRDDPNDRRAKLVEITPAGLEAGAAAMAIHGRMIEHIFGALDLKDRRELRRLLELLRASTDSAAASSELTTSPTAS